MLTALAGSILRPAIFVEMNFVSGPVYIWSGIGSVVWNSHTWLGVGNLGTISAIEDGSHVDARGITLSLSGIDSSLLADALQQMRIGLAVVVRFGLYDASNVLIADPFISWSGRIDQPTIDVSGESAVISINCENRLLDMNVAVDRRYTNDDQQIDHPGDLGFQFVNSIQERQIYWGRLPNNTNV